MKLGQYIGLAIAVCAILEVLSFLFTHALVVRFRKGLILSKVVGVVAAAALMLVLRSLATPVFAQGLVAVAKCKIEANNRLPVGRELRKAEADCYSMLPKRARKVQHADQYDPYVVTEGRYSSESGVGAPYPLARYENGPSEPVPPGAFATATMGPGRGAGEAVPLASKALTPAGEDLSRSGNRWPTASAPRVCGHPVEVQELEQCERCNKGCS